MLEIDEVPGQLSIFPSGLTKSLLIEFKSWLEDERRKRTDKTVYRRHGSSEVQDTEKDAFGGDQGNAVRTGSDEAERQEVAFACFYC